MHDQMPFLGHYVSHDGVEVDPMKTAAVKDWPIPHAVKDVRVFLGLGSYYRCYIPNFDLSGNAPDGFDQKRCQTHMG